MQSDIFSQTPARCAALAFAAAALALAAAPAAPAVLDPTAQYVRAELVAAQDAVAPGGSVWLGLRLRHAPHWHTYWIVPGDAGLPTRLRWSLDAGYVAGPIQWPVPQRLRVGNLANYGYEGDVLLPVSVQVPDSAHIGSQAHFSARADWLVCSDLCIPGGADLSLALPVRTVAQVGPGAEAGAIAAALRRVPQPASLARGRAALRGDRVQLEFSSTQESPRALEFFPLEGGRFVAGADQPLSMRAGRVRLQIPVAMPMESPLTALRGVLVADGGPEAGGSGWAVQVDLPLERAPPAMAGRAGAGPPAGAAVTPELAPPAPAPVDKGAAAAIAQEPPAQPALPPVSLLSVGLAIAGAFLGGMILNLMPCVFPVLSLKLMALVRHRDVAPARLRAHGLAYGCGVVSSFLALAGLLIALRAAGSQIGWGFQLQSPLVIAGLIGLFFLIGANLLGAFEFSFGAGLANSRVAAALDGHGLHGSFGTGILAAVVASPCTAPFMGAALGYAVTQSAGVALVVFAALGAGMAAPYVLLTVVPAWLGHLPRPGAWMERLKQFMAFPMFLTCVWLFWVLGQQVDMDAVAATLAALVGLGVFAWATGLAQRGSAGYRWIAGAAGIASLLVMMPLARSGAPARAPQVSTAAASEWAGWSPEAQRAALAMGEPVFIDFTAAWCITCQANKRLVLHDERVEAAFRTLGVVRLLADWTRRDEAITRELDRFARGGVPMYVLYDRRGVPHLLPEILSSQVVLDALDGI